jgi:hypothetical protein
MMPASPSVYVCIASPGYLPQYFPRESSNKASVTSALRGRVQIIAHTTDFDICGSGFGGFI